MYQKTVNLIIQIFDILKKFLKNNFQCIYIVLQGYINLVQPERRCECKDGRDGRDGRDGTSCGLDGKDGVNGTNGKHGVNGTNGKNGKIGKDGINGKNGKDGVNGRDGKPGIVYRKNWKECSWMAKDDAKDIGLVKVFAIIS